MQLDLRRSSSKQGFGLRQKHDLGKCSEPFSGMRAGLGRRCQSNGLTANNESCLNALVFGFGAKDSCSIAGNVEDENERLVKTEGASFQLTWPWSSSSLLVSLSLSKLTTCRIQVSPDASESGWM